KRPLGRLAVPGRAGRPDGRLVCRIDWNDDTSTAMILADEEIHGCSRGTVAHDSIWVTQCLEQLAESHAVLGNLLFDTRAYAKVSHKNPGWPPRHRSILLALLAVGSPAARAAPRRSVAGRPASCLGLARCLPLSVSSDGAVVGFGEERLHGLERLGAGVEHADPGLRRIDGVRQQLVEGGEVVARAHHAARGGRGRLG